VRHTKTHTNNNKKTNQKSISAEQILKKEPIKDNNKKTLANSLFREMEGSSTAASEETRTKEKRQKQHWH
jgi:hypothetical protein